GPNTLHRHFGRALIERVDPMAPGARQGLPGLVHDDPVEPGLEGAAVLEPVPGPVHPQERLLRHVLGVVKVAGDLVGDRHHSTLAGLHQLLEGELVPVPGAHQEGAPGIDRPGGFTVHWLRNIRWRPYKAYRL